MTARSVASTWPFAPPDTARARAPQPAFGRWMAILCLLAGVLALAPAPARALEPSVVLVERLNTGLLNIMQRAQELGFAGRVTAFEDLLGETYNLRIMARAAIGRSWRKLDDEQKSRLVSAFTAMTVATYAGRFKGFSGERFEVDGAEPSVRGMILVKSRLHRTDDKPVGLNYLTKSYKAGWRIVDVYLDAKYSELARLRAEFASVMAKEGFDGLIARIEDRAARANEG